MDKVKQLIKFFNIDESMGEDYVFERLKLELKSKLDDDKTQQLKLQVHEYFEALDQREGVAETRQDIPIQEEMSDTESKSEETPIVSIPKQTGIQPMRIALLVVSGLGFIGALALPKIFIETESILINIIMTLFIGVAYIVFDILEAQSDPNRKNKISHLLSVIMAILFISIGFVLILGSVIGGNFFFYGLIATFILGRVCVIFSLGVITLFVLSAFTPLDFVRVRVTR